MRLHIDIKLVCYQAAEWTLKTLQADEGLYSLSWPTTLQPGWYSVSQLESISKGGSRKGFVVVRPPFLPAHRYPDIRT